MNARIAVYGISASRECGGNRRRAVSKPILGLLLGGILGAFDGLSAIMYPETRDEIVGIVIGSTIKGLIAGIATGYFAKKYQSLSVGILFGLGIGLILAYLVVVMDGRGFYLEIMLPGGLVGLIVGFATQRYGAAPRAGA
jgi:hypothetical protein